MKRTVAMILPSTAPQTADATLDRLFEPPRLCRQPVDVLNDDRLEVQEKRAIFSSWASDACAVESMPALRQPPGAEQPVAFDDIMVALGELDSDRGYIRPTTTSDRKYRSDQSLDA